MKTLILAGGYGTRLSEETGIRPKPMVEIGGKPILWHIMKTYDFYGYQNFGILLGYKGDYITDYFTNYHDNHSVIDVDLSTGKIETKDSHSENWQVSLIPTGRDTLTGGRILRAKKYTNNEPFMLTYGDGVGNINISKLVESHRASNKILTMTVFQPSGRFGSISFNSNNEITSFVEKPKKDQRWINSGFFVCEQKIFDYISGDQSIFEQETLTKLAEERQVNVYTHDSFWHCMDTLADAEALRKMWNNKTAEWVVW